MALCPFHNDRHPSLYVSDDHYHLFRLWGAWGCDRSWPPNCLTFGCMMRPENWRLTFNLHRTKPLCRAIRRKRNTKPKHSGFGKNEQLCFSVLNKYRRCFLDWKNGMHHKRRKMYWTSGLWKPATGCHGQRISWTILLQGDSYERGEVVSNLTADGYIRKLQARLREEQYHEHPVWIDEKGKIIEPEYCRDFPVPASNALYQRPLYTVEGSLPDESKIKANDLWESRPGSMPRSHRRWSRYSNVEAGGIYRPFAPAMWPHPCSKRHLFSGWHVYRGKSIAATACRYPIGLMLRHRNIGCVSFRNCWSRRDIPALQEYLGYCLIPSTKGKKMLMLIGKGGEGQKPDQCGDERHFGLNMNTTSIQKVETNRFARADLEGKLLMVDDDLDMNALTKTNYVKSIVTAELRMDLERKKEQSYQGAALCTLPSALATGHWLRFTTAATVSFTARSFLTTKDKPADRFDDPFLAEKLIAEKEGIFLWMLEGLRWLIANHYHFTISQRAKDNISSAVRDANNILDFLDSQGLCGIQGRLWSQHQNLYAAYKRWCEDNAENPLSPKSFANQLSQKQNATILETSQ